VRRKKKNPVLTSPWKIGVVVVLLLLISNTGVGYYIINQYNIDLKWISSGSSNILGIDSPMFFKEIFPLAAGIILCSLFSYFVIASTVRKYRYYVDSGQDYRKMISLADSMDDLTNPVQIARLSNYPELQTILRNYGDKIREISNEINLKGEQFASDEFEMEIDSLLSGKSVLQSGSEEKWWTGIVKKLNDEFREKDKVTERQAKIVEDERRKTGEVTLSFGKVIEYTNEAMENLSDIGSSMSSVRENLQNIDKETVEGGAETTQQIGSDLKSALSNMNKSLDKLEDGGIAMREFSERNNGLALNIALLAARGNIKDNDLASFAEKARGTAEQFNKLGNAVINLSRNLSKDYQVFKSWIVNGNTGLDSGLPSAEKAIIQITDSVGKSREKLEKNLGNLKDGLESINLILRDKVTVNKEDEYYDASEIRETPEEIGQTSGDKESDYKEKLVVNHGSTWDSNNLVKESFKDAASSQDVINEENEVKSGESKINLGGFKESVQLPDLPEIKDPELDIGNALDDTGNQDLKDEEISDESWTSLNVRRGENDSIPEDIDVEFREDGVGDVMEDSKEKPEPLAVEESVSDKPSVYEGVGDYEQSEGNGLGIEIAYRKHLDKSVKRQLKTPLTDKSANEKSVNVNDEGPIVDLFELGAVEIESAEARQ